MYSMFNIIETLFYLSLAITFFLMILLVYHFKQRISFLEQKNETMFEIINNIVKELNNIKNSFIEFERAKENMNDSIDEAIEKAIQKVERHVEDDDVEEVDEMETNKMNSGNYNVKIVHLNDLMNEKLNMGSFLNENFPVSFMNSFQPLMEEDGEMNSFSGMKYNKMGEDEDIDDVINLVEEEEEEEGIAVDFSEGDDALNKKLNINVSKIENVNVDVDVDVECISLDEPEPEPEPADSDVDEDSDSEDEPEPEHEDEPEATNKNIIDYDDDETQEEFNEKNTNMIDLEKKYKKMNITQLRKIIKENNTIEEDSIKIDKMKKNDLIKLLLNNI